VLRRALVREPRLLVRLGVWSVAETAPALIVGTAIARAVDDGFAAGRVGTGFAWLAVLAGAWLVGAAGAKRVVLVVAGLAEPFREDLLAHVVRATLRDTTRAGTAAVARANLQVELARDAFASVVSVLRSFAFTVVGVLIGLTGLAPEVLVLVLPPFAAGLGVFLLSLPALLRRERDYLLADERTAESLAATVAGLRDVAACGAEDRAAGRAGLRVTAQETAGVSLARLTAARTVALAVGGRAPALLLLAGTPWLVAGGAGPGVILGALAYVTQSLAPALGTLVQGLGIAGVRLTVSLDRILGPTPSPAAATRAALPAPAPPSPPRGKVELRGVTFAYGPHAAPVIDGLDLTVRDGEHLAVVGPSGIGKSTLAGLLAGLLLPGSGRVLVGGAPADRVPPAARVLIPQEAYVFRGTLRENLSFLHETATDAELWAAMDAVGLTAPTAVTGRTGLAAPTGPTGFAAVTGPTGLTGAGAAAVEHSVDPVVDPVVEPALAPIGEPGRRCAADAAEERLGLDAEVEPGELSAGRRQLVALARAYLSPAPLVILDEATCHLDPAAEARAEEAFAAQGRTLIVIAHRLTSALRAQRVLIMDGAAVQCGPHDELLARSPLYADLLGHWPARPSAPLAPTSHRRSRECPR
jgi:ATP-binding cassette subfamily C protein